jgi:hypothetical protein
MAACGVGPAPPNIDRAILGERPGYGPAVTSEVPNMAAIDRMIWMPGLADGWDPQGLAFAGGSLFVSGYRSSGMWQSRGPCRVFRVDPETGRETGHFDVPPPCGHAGGLAYAGGGSLFVADTHTLFEVDLDQAFGDQASGGAGAKFRVFRLGAGLKGAFAVSGSGAVWLGGYQEDRPAKAYKFATATIESLPDGAILSAEAASAVAPIPTFAQGGAPDAAGALWIARSDIGWGFLDRIDHITGRLRQRFAAPGAIEGIAFDPRGRLWVVSEAGARHLPLRYPFFPVIFRLDPARLAAAHPAD